MERRKRLLLVGCGEYARRAHLPVLGEHRADVSVGAALVGDQDVHSTREALVAQGLEVPPIYGVPRDIKATIRELGRVVAAHAPLDAAIVSTISAFNFSVVRFCLESGLHVLVEKPATCPPHCSWDPGQAEQIFPQLQMLVETAHDRGKRLLVGAQRRYEGVYSEVREMLRTDPPETIQVAHALGWGRDSETLGAEYSGWRRLSDFTGGKIMHSGYHVIDVVMWWLYHAGCAVTHARVTSFFRRFGYPRFVVNYKNHNIEKTAMVQAQFFAHDQLAEPICTASFHLTLAGPARSTRETYFIVLRSQNRLTIERDRGQRNDEIPTMTMQRDGERNATSVSVPNARAGNQEPARDLIRGLLGRLPSAETSVGSQHLWSAQIVQAAYLSAIRGQVEQVAFTGVP